jgi:23S rRNA (adenine-N6)-dimethyltransferase
MARRKPEGRVPPGRRVRTERDIRRRTYSQNFLRSPELVQSLVKQARIEPTDLVIEPGAGTGVITQELARRAERVVAIELDPDWFKRLSDRFADVENVEVRLEDFFSYRLPGHPYRVFGNIPFRQTTRLLRHLLDQARNSPERADMIVQAEVARKHSARRASNALTASWQPWFEFEILRPIHASAFRPVPRVDAALLSIVKKTNPLLPVSNRRSFVDFVSAGFSAPVVWEGLRRTLTANQVRQLRRHSDIGPEVKPSALAVTEWTELYQSSLLFRRS